ncbi:alpha/beta hydrolase [bacterium SCSIO 12741]|nr:alpha/beta hydrolase [bacterium SCSIO 12741]
MLRLLFLLLIISQVSFAQTRYFDPSFGVGVTYGRPYGESNKKQGEGGEKMVTLLMDVYQPLNDTLKNRPLIIFAHGGAFLMGDKNNFPMETLCSRFAQMGYVTASINYRKTFIKAPTDQLSGEKTVIRPIHDMKAAVRYFRKSVVENGNPYGVDTSWIWVGGSSAGAIVALHVAYLDSQDIKHLELNLDNWGGLEGNSGNPGYSSKVHGVINLCGAIGDTAFMNEALPVINIHGSEDPIVPVNDDSIRYDLPLVYIPRVKLQGSECIYARNLEHDTPSEIHLFPNQGHCPYDKTLDRKRYPVNMDITVNLIRNFLYNTYWNTGPPVTDKSTSHATAIDWDYKDGTMQFYPVDKAVKKIKIYVMDENYERMKKKVLRKKLKAFTWKYTPPETPHIITVRYNGFYRTKHYPTP